MGAMMPKLVRIHSDKSRQTKANIGKQARRASWLHHQLAQGRAKCEYCKGRVSREVPHGNPIFATVDHIIPISKGGYDGPRNWRICCQRCNEAKSATMPDAWRPNAAKP